MATKTESIIDKVLLQLETKLPAKLTAEGLALPDTTALPASGGKYGYRYGEPSLTPSMGSPIAWVDDEGGTQAHHVLGEASPRAKSREYHLLVGVVVGGTDAHDMKRRLDKYVDLIIAALEEDSTLGGAVLWSQVVRWDKSPTLGAGNALFRAGIVTLDALVRRAMKSV